MTSLVSTNDHKMRPFVVTKVSEILNLPVDDNRCINIEKSIYNWTIDEAIKLSHAVSWENPELGIYINKNTQALNIIWKNHQN